MTEVEEFDRMYNEYLIKWEKDYEAKEITFWLSTDIGREKIHKFKYKE